RSIGRTRAADAARAYQDEATAGGTAAVDTGSVRIVTRAIAIVAGACTAAATHYQARRRKRSEEGAANGLVARGYRSRSRVNARPAT
nr:hypothetical protein [Tanacetum cinerariifolium]